MLNLRLPLPVFRNAKEIVTGINSRSALRGISSNKCLLVISKSFMRSDYLEQIKRLIKSECVVVFVKDWEGEPNLENLENLVRMCEEFKPDYIVALGGGSIIDGAKIAWLFYECPDIDRELLFKPFSIPRLRSKAQFAAIPTTVGSGSEVSSAAVIHDLKNKSKRAIVSHEFLPDLVILDPLLVCEVPQKTLRITVGDSLSHAIEGYVSKISNPLMDVFAEKSISLIFSHQKSFKDEKWSCEMVADLQLASMMAGWVQNHCVVGICHAIAHQLSDFGISHALANCILMPTTIKFNMREAKTKLRYQSLFENSGLQNLENLEEIFKILHDKDKLDINIDGLSLENVCKNALLDPAAKTNPSEFNEKDVKEILEKCL
jgi:alcohol dehydrogenase